MLNPGVQVEIFVDGARQLTSVWTPPPPIASRKDRAFVPVIGNSGAGKSTLVREIARRLALPAKSVVAIDERATHHPFLDRLFYAPDRYGYELQLNFMVQRLLIARRWLDAGFCVVMERSHLDDRIFIEHLLDEGVVTQAERDVYVDLWSALASRAPEPDLVIALDVAPAECARRITEAELAGERPREYPDEATKERWLASWGALYQRRIAELRTSSEYSARVLVVDDRMMPPETARWAVERLLIKQRENQ